ncbi:MAG: hypothetical protein AAF677_14585 [Pseudomonadota bacterium]
MGAVGAAGRAVRLGLAAALVWLVAAGAAAALDGDYRGIDSAEGASLKVEGDGGTLTDADGARAAFEGRASAGGLEARVVLGGADVLLRLDPLPYGVLATLIPLGADGTLQTAGAEALTFVRRDLTVPTLPHGFVAPPAPGITRIAAMSFLRSYAFWTPEGVEAGYLALAARHRRLIALFPAVQLDIIWKLCLAPGADRALGLALQGQGVACEDVRARIAAAQRSGGFDRYKEEVAEAAETLSTALQCADSHVMAKEVCDAAARDVSAQALSLETAATVLARVR